MPYIFDQPARITEKVVAQSVSSGSPNSVTPLLTLGLMQFITVPSSLGTFTINAPSTTSNAGDQNLYADANNYMFWSMRLKNSSGGTLTVTLNSAFLTVSPTWPANGKSRVYTFLWDGTNHILMYQSAADLG